MTEYLQAALLWSIRQLWMSLPLFAAVGAMLIVMAPANLFHEIVPVPDLVLISVFYWAIFGPGLLPPWAVFVLGLAQDFATGGAIGFWALTYLMAYGFTLSQRVFFTGRSGPGVWFGFALIAGVTAAVAWLLGSITYAHWLPPGPIILQGAMSVLVYPLAARVFAPIRRALTSAGEAP